MKRTRAVCGLALGSLFVVLLVASGSLANGAETVIRLDCGTADSPVMPGYERITSEEMYDASRGYGWEGTKPESVEFQKVFDFRTLGMYAQHMQENLNELNGDAVISRDELVFRADVPDGLYRVTVTIGDMRQNIGSIDVFVNDRLVAEHLAAWSPGGRGGGGHHRRLMQTPDGWWTNELTTVEVRNEQIRIRLTKNQSYYDEMISKQAVEEKEWEDSMVAAGGEAPYKRVGVERAPYYYVGWPFVHNSLMAIEIRPHHQAPVVGEDDKLVMTRPIASAGLKDAMARFNRQDFVGALDALDGVGEPDAQVAKAIVMLWVAGRLELEMEKSLVPRAIRILGPYVAAHPEENGVAEILRDAEIFEKAMQLHLTRGEAVLGENHFVENGKAIGWWWMIHKGSPLYYKARLHLARAEHMLIPYFPARGTYREVFKELEKKFPHNRYVRYHLYEEWEPYGDGTRFDDWYMKDYTAKVKDSPEWVRQLYPAFQTVADWCEWWVKWKQQPEGSIGGGWGDDVEIVGAFGYMGYASRDISDLLVKGTGRLVDGVWNLSEVDPELGYCLPMGDAEHTAEWTGNTLGMMVQIDYGNPLWIERSMKTGKLLRDLWTGYDDKGHRHFRANFFSAAQVGSGARTNDSWINYRAIRPAHAVLAYNLNPAISRLIVELADGWVAPAMSTDRGKPYGVIPAEVGFPSGMIGGVRSPSWYEAYHDNTTANANWDDQGYKAYLQDLLIAAFKQTGDAKYLEPLRLEYELAARYGNLPEVRSGARLQLVEYPQEFGKRNRRIKPPPRKAEERAPGAEPQPGAEEWVSAKLGGVNEWLVAKRIVEGRKGKLENDITREDVIRSSTWVNSQYKWLWPLSTTEAGPTDRIAFVGLVNPFIVYTGGRLGGPLLEAAVTYSNTTRDFAAAVLAADAQGFRLLYHSLGEDTREVSILPWHLEPAGRYVLSYGPDANEDDVMDETVEKRAFDFPQLGTPIPITVEPRKTYLVEVDQLERGARASLASDPALSGGDIGYEKLYGLILARVHNVGSKPVRGVKVAAYDGQPEAGGTLIRTAIIPNIEAPVDLEPRTTTVGFSWSPTGASHDIYIVLDPDDEIKDEITTFNNVAHRMLPEEEARTAAEGSA